MPVLAKELSKLSCELSRKTSTRFEFHKEYFWNKGITIKTPAYFVVIMLMILKEKTSCIHDSSSQDVNAITMYYSFTSSVQHENFIKQRKENANSRFLGCNDYKLLPLLKTSKRKFCKIILYWCSETNCLSWIWKFSKLFSLRVSSYNQQKSLPVNDNTEVGKKWEGQGGINYLSISWEGWKPSAERVASVCTRIQLQQQRK